MSKVNWKSVCDYSDIRLETSGDGIAKITIDRPEKRNAFRPETVKQLIDAFHRVREDGSVGVVLLTGEGPLAFCSVQARFKHCNPDRYRDLEIVTPVLAGIAGV